MKAAVLEEYGKFNIVERDVPEPGDDEVLMRVRYASICGSDQHLFKGEFHPRTPIPYVPGHEFAGEVSKVGKNVNSYREGDLITVDPIIPCGKCPACKEQHYPACPSLKLLGIDLDGGFQEYLVVKPEMVYKLPPAIDLKYASLIELLAIGFHASRRSGLKKENSIAIWGAGKVGNAILYASRVLSEGPVFVVDVLQERLDMAKKAFPDIHTLNPNKTNPISYIRDYTGNSGVDIAFEAVGHHVEIEGVENPVRSCVQAIRGGGTVCTLGLGDDPVEVLMKELIWKEARIVASRVSHGEFSDTINALGASKLQPSGMITGIMDLEKINEAFELLEKEPQKYLKILLKI